jgi:hypothetical protein
LNLIDALKEIAQDIREHFPHHAKTLDGVATQWSDIAAPAKPDIPPAGMPPGLADQAEADPPA